MDISPDSQSQTLVKNNSDGFYRYLSIGCMSVAGLLMLFFYQWDTEGRWMLKSHERVVELSAQFLPVPFAYLAWVRMIERTHKFKLTFSPFFCILSMECFLAVQGVRWLHVAAVYSLAVAIVAGFFVLVPFGEAMRRVMENKRATLVAIFAATAALDYYALLHDFWETMCGATSRVVYTLARIFQYDVQIGVQHTNRAVVSISSPSFSILVFPDCSGLEGIFLFAFLLSVMLLFDWELFKHKSLLLLYTFGAVYMFFINALRIFLFFSLGYFAYRPDVPSWLQSLRGTPIMLFHSYEGWIFYLIAFGIFAAWMYRPQAAAVGSDKSLPSS